MTTSMVTDGMYVVAEHVEAGSTYYYRGMNLIGYTSEDDVGYYRFNAHGDVVAVADVAGKVITEYEYDPFGKLEDDENEWLKILFGIYVEDSNPFRYCAEYYDSETEFIYLRARYYSPDLQRFISEDPIRDGNNWYAYCGNNPLNRVDPNGKSWEDTVLGITSAIDNGALFDIVSWVLDKFGKDLQGYSPNDQEDYYLGRLVGDVICMLIDAGMAAKGIFDIITAIITGGAITVLSDGSLAAGGIEIAIAGVTEGAIELSGTVVASCRTTENFADDFQNWQYAKANNEFQTQGKQRILVDQGSQDKHIVGTNNFKTSMSKGEHRSILTAEPQELLDNYAGKGNKISDTKERVNFGKVIGQYYDADTGKYVNTTNGIIHYKANGTAHIVPAHP